MARITRVRTAQQRYETKQVFDSEGNPVRTPVMGRNGEQKVSKRGPVFMAVTVADKTKPLPNATCGKCGIEIKPGDPYKHISPKSGPYGGRRLVRCAACPDWQIWDYSSSLNARTQQIAFNCEQDIQNAETPDDVTAALESMVEEVRSLAEEKRESASNIEEGFGHPTSASEELNDIADQLDSWADEVEEADVPETDEYGCQTCMSEGEENCSECIEGTITSEDGTGTGTCENCDGTGVMPCSECEAEEDYVDLDAWRSAVQDGASVINECPV